MIAGIITWICLIGFFSFIGVYGYKAWVEEGRPSLRPRTSTVVIFLIAGFVLFALATDKSKHMTPQERLDAEARDLIRQHNAQVDRDAREMMVRIRAEQMMRGR